jgi:hypothetical protein
LDLWCDQNQSGNGPHASHEFTRNGPRDAVGVFPSSHELSVAFTEPDVRFPTDVLDDWRLFFQPPLQGATARGGVTIGPGACDESLAGMGGASLGTRPLSALRPRRIFRGDQAHKLHQGSGGLKARQVTHGCHHGHGPRTLDATEGLQGLDHRRQAPGVDVLAECLCETLEACGVFRPSAASCLQDAGWRWCGTKHRGEPPPVSRAPMGSAWGTDILSQQKGVAPALGILAIAAGLCTGSGKSPDRCLFHLGALDGGAVSRARQPRALHGVSAVGLDPIAWFVRDQRGGDHPAGGAWFRPIAVAPGATGASCRDEDERFGLGWPRADEGSAITLARAQGAEESDRGAVIWRHIRDGHRLLVDLHSEQECARRGPGCPPRG